MNKTITTFITSHCIRGAYLTKEINDTTLESNSFSCKSQLKAQMNRRGGPRVLYASNTMPVRMSNSIWKPFSWGNIRRLYATTFWLECLNVLTVIASWLKDTQEELNSWLVHSVWPHLRVCCHNPPPPWSLIVCLGHAKAFRVTGTKYI